MVRDLDEVLGRRRLADEHGIGVVFLDDVVDGIDLGVDLVG